MPLTKKQLSEIEALVEDRFLRFSFEALGRGALSEAEIRKLQGKLLLRSSVRSMIGDAYVLGKIAALVDRRRTKTVTFKEVEKLAGKMLPMTDVEKKAIEYASAHAGEYIRGLRDNMVRDTRALSARHSGAALRTVRSGVSEAIANRRTISELKTDLFHSFDDRYRDWQRIAHTEINTSIQQGIYHEIQEKSEDGGEQLVFKRPNPDACPHCKRVYLRDDGITPKVFKLSDLAETNVGRKANNWLPTIGSVHPWCNCQLQVVPDGFDFVKKKVVVKPFKNKGQDYTKGETITDEEYAQFSESQKQKLGWDAVLSFTGESPEPIQKAELSQMLSDEDDSICEHA